MAPKLRSHRPFQCILLSPVLDELAETRQSLALRIAPARARIFEFIRNWLVYLRVIIDNLYWLVHFQLGLALFKRAAKQQFGILVPLGDSVGADQDGKEAPKESVRRAIRNHQVDTGLVGFCGAITQDVSFVRAAL